MVMIFTETEFKKKEFRKKIIKLGENERNMEIFPKNTIGDISLIVMDILKMLMEK